MSLLRCALSILYAPFISTPCNSVSQSLCQLLPDRCGEAFGICDADPQHGMVPEPDNPGNFVHERDTQPFVMVRAKSESIVGEAEPKPNCRVPAVRSRDEGMVDIIERGLHAEPAKGGDEFTSIGDIDAVIVADAQRQEQSCPSFIEPVWEVLRRHDFSFRCGVAAMSILTLLQCENATLSA